MAISTIGSYLPTMDGFIDHWTAVNASISPTVLTLQGGYALADFQSDRDAIETAIAFIETVDNGRQFASSDRDLKKGSARTRIGQYRATVTGVLAGTPYVNTLPLMPKFGVNPALFTKAMNDMANGWDRINTDTIAGFTPPLLLAGGYTLAGYNTELAAMLAAFVASTNAEDNSRQARSVRDSLLAPAKARMVQYRQTAKGILPAGDPLLATIPAVSPPPGSTPAAVNASVIWNILTNMADITWTPSTNPNLLHYSIRTAPGPTYRAADESVIGEVLPGTLTFSTAEGLVVSGARALYRVYVVLTTLNERGSNTLSVTRP